MSQEKKFKSPIVICYAHGYKMEITAIDDIISGVIKPVGHDKPFKLEPDENGKLVLRLETEK